MSLNRISTHSLCPQCLERIPARRVMAGDSVYLEKTCPRHGPFRTVVWRGDPGFGQWRRDKIPAEPPPDGTMGPLGCPFDCGLCALHRQRSCTVILEVTSRCDQGCRICYADSGKTGADAPMPLIAGWFRRLADNRNFCNIQLSGGEPTLRDDLPAVVALGRQAGFDFIQLNTNGLRLGQDPAFTRALRDAGLSSVFLQFDSPDDAVNAQLRGRAGATRHKLAAIEACAACGLGVVLVPTLVPGLNTSQIGAILNLALAHSPTVRGVHFQPISYFGRYPENPQDEARLTIPEIIRAIQTQTNGLISADTFCPPGCENALCSFHGNYVVLPGGELKTITRHKEDACCCKPAINACSRPSAIIESCSTSGLSM